PVRVRRHADLERRGLHLSGLDRAGEPLVPPRAPSLRTGRFFAGKPSRPGRLRAGIISAAALVTVILAAGCGGNRHDAREQACAQLDVAPVSNASLGMRTLRNGIAGDQKAIDALDENDPLASRFRGARARAAQVLSSFSSDPLRSGSMSPTATILPAT